MAGITRSSMRDSDVKEPISSNDGSAVPTPLGSERSSARDDISRLSADVEPIHLVDRDAVPSHSAPTAAGYEPVGQHLKAIIAAISRLEALGLQKLNIPLPKCIVVGDQSAGKSSVIESISGITTPRSGGTCTRCPLFINMAPSNDPLAKWSAKVSLRRGFVYDGVTGDGFEHRFPGWHQTPGMSEQHFDTTNSREQLQDLIGRAQTALVCPRAPLSVFVNQPKALFPAQTSRCDFSPNVVIIEITAPELPNLSFYDLPGIIGQSRDPKKPFLVQFVRDIVTDYIKDPDALILLACSLNNDIATSAAGGLVRAHGSEARCVGVLTKPDKSAEVSEELRDVLNGSEFPLGHGYFVVRNLSQPEIDQGLTHHDARQRERHFFSKAPWTTDFQRYESRFGTPNLQTFLSKKLAALVSDKLPIIREEIDNRLIDITNELGSIPETPSYSAVGIVARVVSSFALEVAQEMNHEFDHTNWWDDWEILQKAFYDALQAMKPKLKCGGRRDDSIFLHSLPGRSPEDSIVLDSDDEEGQNAQTSEAPETPAKKRKREADTPGLPIFKTPTKTPTKAKNTPNRRAKPSKSGNKPEPTDFSKEKKVFELDEIEAEIAAKSKSKVPGQVHHRVRKELMVLPTAKWELAVNLFFNTLEERLVKWLKTLFNKHFGSWNEAELYRRAWAAVDDIIQNNISEQRNVMAAGTLKDQKQVYIWPRETFEKEKAIYLSKYHDFRPTLRLKRYQEEMANHYDRDLTPKELKEMEKDAEVMKRVREEPYPNSVFDVMADVAAYYDIASSRFHNAICMRVESKFFTQLREELQAELVSTLAIFDGDDGPRNAQMLLAESPEREQRRREFITQQDSLNKGLQVLDELQNTYQDSPAYQDNHMY